MPAWHLCASLSWGGETWGNTTHFMAALGNLYDVANEAHAQVKAYVGYKAAKLLVHIGSNGRSVDATFVFRVNSLSTSVAVTVPAGASGDFEDTAHTAPVASGDLYCLQYVGGTGSGNIVVEAVSIVLTGSSPPIGIGYIGIAGSNYFPITGGGGISIEANVQYRVRQAQTLSRLSVYVSSNTRDGDSTVRFRKNTANGNQVVTIPVGATGIFEDLVNSDALVSADLICTRVTSGGTTGSLSITCIVYLSDSSDRIAGCACAAVDVNQAEGWAYPEGLLSGQLWTAARSLKVRALTFTAKLLLVRVTSNAATGAVTVAVQKNGADTALIVTIPAGGTGWYEETTQSVGFVAGDTYAYHHLRVSGSGNVRYTIMGIETTGTPAPTGMAGLNPGMLELVLR